MPTKSLKPKIATTELGDSGTYIYNGQIESPDPNRDLVGDQGIDTYNRMRLGDASVKAAYLACILPILSANWRVDPASDSEEDKGIAEWVWQQYNGMTRTFFEYLRESLLHLIFGHYVFETVYKETEDGKIGLKKLAPRVPKSIFSWQMQDGRDGITQTKTSGEQVSIPIEKLIIFVNEREGDNWEGISLLRAAYKAWHMKETLEKIDAIAHERQGVGIPKITSAAGAVTGDKDGAIDAAKNLRANAEGYLYVPPGFEIDFMNMNTTDRKPLESAEYHRFEIFLSVLGTFLTLGSTDSGSRALSTDLSDFFEMAVKHVASVGFAAPNNKYLIPRLVDMNFTVKEYPTLAFDGIGKFDFKAIVESITGLSGAKQWTPDLTVENTLRKAMNLPEAPEDTYYPDPTQEPQTPPALVVEEKEQPTDAKMSFINQFARSETQALKLALDELKEG